jgi:hypothetical protein
MLFRSDIPQQGSFEYLLGRPIHATEEYSGRRGLDHIAKELSTAFCLSQDILGRVYICKPNRVGFDERCSVGLRVGWFGLVIS